MKKVFVTMQAIKGRKDRRKKKEKMTLNYNYQEKQKQKHTIKHINTRGADNHVRQSIFTLSIKRNVTHNGKYNQNQNKLPSAHVWKILVLSEELSGTEQKRRTAVGGGDDQRGKVLQGKKTS